MRTETARQPAQLCNARFKLRLFEDARGSLFRGFAQSFFERFCLLAKSGHGFALRRHA